ncbi:MAG: PEP-CTERM sorting domain-containing protein [Pseudomonadota bacterium]
MRKTLALLLLAAAPISANAAVISIDFDSAATGSDIINNPLATVAGNVTASASGGTLTIREFPGGSGDGLGHNQSGGGDGSFAQLAFDFDASSIEFLYAGFVGGNFLAQALDSSFNVIDSFFDDNTSDDLPGGPITLAGAGIRYFRFNDSPGGGVVSGVDSLVITTIDVPEPTTLGLLGLGLAGLGLARRRRQS